MIILSQLSYGDRVEHDSPRSGGRGGGGNRNSGGGQSSSSQVSAGSRNGRSR